MRKHLSVALFAANLAAIPCLAQLVSQQGNAESRMASIPYELFTVFMATGGGYSARSASYFVDTLPPGFPTLLTLPGGRVVGGIVRGQQLIAIFADTSKRPLVAYENMLDATGWSAPPLPETNGFITSSPYRRYCRGSGEVYPSSATGASGRSYVIATYQPLRVSCNAQAEAQTARMNQTLAMPKLAPPPDAAQRSASSGDGGDEIHAMVRLQTMLNPSVILSHYAGQLTSAGWTTTPAVVNNMIAAQPFEARDKTGMVWRGMLTVLYSEDDRIVQLQMRRTGGS